MAEPISIVIEEDGDDVRVDPVTGTVEVDQPDGGVVVQLDAQRGGKGRDPEDHYANLADKIDSVMLANIGEELFTAVNADNDSRAGYLATRARGFDLLGIKLQEPRTEIGQASAAAEGLSSVTNPLLLETCLKAWANAEGELLPADGPAKVVNVGNATSEIDELAEAFEKGFNHYLTVTATEYYPDTSHMLLWGPIFGGSGFKKIYRCPMRKRPVSESVDPKDLIVSDTTKDLRSCARITHQISMRPSVMKRMVLMGAYIEEPIGPPTPTPTAVDTKIAGIQGTQPPKRPEDQPFTIWEIQCELDIPEFAPGQFKNEGIPLPYLVSMDKDTRKVLAIRRDWHDDDEDCQRAKMYVKYPYVPGPGFYGTGQLNILGNCSAAMTAAWREALDAGMFANFPAFLIAKLTGRQNTSEMRLSPGQGQPIETGGNPIGNMVMGLPYKDITPGLMALMDKILVQARSLGAAPDTPSGEGIQNVPVGTMLAHIEQATKVMAATHRSMHGAQAEEFELIIDLFRRYPQDFWEHNRECAPNYWSEQKFLEAVRLCQLVPRSDPNVPSHLHRVAKGVALTQLIINPVLGSRMDPGETLKRVLNAMREDPDGLVVEPPPAGEPPLEAKAKMVQAQASATSAQAKVTEAQTKGALEAQKMQAQKEKDIIDLADSIVVHQADFAKLQRQSATDAAKIQREDAKIRQQGVANERSFALDAAKHQEAVRERIQEADLRTREMLNSPKPAK